MTQTDADFSGKIPETYDAHMVPLFFEPYALDLSDRVAKHEPARILELAAGTGALTRELVHRVSDVEIVATDLSPAMLDRASRVLKKPDVSFEVADATALPFDDASFDVVVSQFGVMFFPDKIAAFREAHRVLRDGGALLFSIWNSIFKNPVSKVIAKAFKENSGGAPCFLERAVFAYCDDGDIKSDLRAAGFAKIDVFTVAKTTKVHSAAAILDALAGGTPMAADFEHLGRDRGAHVREAIFEALTSAFGDDGFENQMSALVVEVKK